jgi:hypothetical protein
VKTWWVEALVAGIALGAVATLTSTPATLYVSWIGAVAVLLSFMHMQVAERLAEAQGFKAGSTQDIEVECYWKLKWYLVGKELLWLAYFVLLDAWPALVGVGLFLLYPVWRHYRKRYPRA